MILKKLSEVTQIIAGGTPKSSVNEYWNGSVFWITPSDMGKLKTSYVDNTSRKITELGLQNSSAKIFPENSVILSTRAPIGHIAINKVAMSTNQGCKSLVTNQNLDTKYLFYYLKHIKKHLQDLGTGTTFKELSSSKLKEVEIPILPLSEQKQIVEILDKTFEKIDKAIANIERNIENAKELFQSKLNQIFYQTDEGFDMSWQINKISDIYDVRDGTHDSPKYVDKGHPLITSKNLKNNQVNYNKVKFISNEDYNHINKRSRVDIGDVLFAMIGTIGNPVVINKEPDFAIKNVALFKPKGNQNSNFLRYYLESNRTISKMKSEAKGTTQKFVGLAYLRNFLIQTPPLSDQKQIVETLDNLNNQVQSIISTYMKELKNLEELKKSILEKAFKGELTSAA